MLRNMLAQASRAKPLTVLKGEHMKNIKLVIFDMDGTMLDTERASMQAWQDAIIEMNYPITPAEFEPIALKIIGTNAANCKAQVKAAVGDDFDSDMAYERHLFHLDETFKKHGIPVKAGLLELLDKLEALGIKKCVATSTAKERATQKLASVNVAHRFEVIVGGDQVVNSKPDPEIFLMAAAHCGVAPENCLVLEDSTLGTLGGYRAGMKVINIPDLLPPTEEILGMATVVDSLFDVVEMF